MKNISEMRILYFGALKGNSGSRFRGMQKMVGEVEPVFHKDIFKIFPRPCISLEWRLCNGPITYLVNRAFLKRALEFRPDLVWTEMGKLTYANTLRQIKEKCNCILVNSYSDDFLDPMKVSRHYNRSVELYDYIFTPRDINFAELYRRGAKRAGKFWKGFDYEVHLPQKLTKEEQKVYSTDVVFAGHYEPSREEPFSELAKAIERFKIWGNGWKKCVAEFPPGVIQYRGAEGHEYRKALCGAKIALQHMARWSRDTQSSRSFEIPACGVMLLAERTDDHLACFEEDKEAVFFSSTEELIEKAKFYLRNDALRKRIAEAGYKRCVESGYSNHDRIRVMLEEVMNHISNIE